MHPKPIHTIFSKEFNDLIKKLSSKEYQEYFHHLETKLIPSFILLDWYVSWRFLDFSDLENLFYQEEKTGVNAQISNAFDSYQSECRNTLTKSFPERGKILREIFFCYKHKQYSAVIALAYSTAEGIVHDVFGQGFWGGYREKTRKTHMNRLSEKQKVTGVLNLFKKRLNHRGEVNGPADESLHISVDSNNRHFVLHGQAYKYGTKKNAIKAILLLDFIDELIYWEKHLKDL